MSEPISLRDVKEQHARLMKAVGERNATVAGEAAYTLAINTPALVEAVEALNLLVTLDGKNCKTIAVSEERDEVVVTVSMDAFAGAGHAIARFSFDTEEGT